MNDGRANIGDRFFYGWVVAAACSLLLAVSIGICFSFGVFFTSLNEDFAWTRAATSSIFSWYLLLGGLFSIFGGWFSDKWGPRPVVLIMGIITGASLCLTSLVESAWHIFLTYSVFLSLGNSAIYIIVMSTGSRWFLTNRASALGLIGFGAGLGTLVMAPTSSWLITSFTWRQAYLVIGILAWTLMIPPALLLKQKPEDIGVKPDGESPKAGEAPTNIADAKDFTLKEAARTRNLWLLFFIWFSFSYCVHTVMTHVAPRAQDAGIDPFKAASILSVAGGVSMLFRLISGRISDTREKRAVARFFALLCAVAMFWLIGANRLWMFYLFATLFGAAYGGLDPPIVSMIGRVFGLRHIGSIMGMLMVGWSCGAAAGPYISGLIYDRMGGYGLAFLSGGLIMIITAGCIGGLRMPGEGAGDEPNQRSA